MRGIYAIINKLNFKVYVGKSGNINRRAKRHFSQLRKNKHHNQKLQNSWNKYGEKIFYYRILEESSDENLNLKEISWINCMKFLNNEFGYNLEMPTETGKVVSEETRKKLSDAICYKKYQFKSPTGEIIFVNHLENFCRENNLEAGNMRSVFYGKGSCLTCKGWTAVNPRPRKSLKKTQEQRDKLAASKAYKWNFINPAGKQVEFVNLKKFCRENNLNFTGMWKLSRNLIKEYKGWKNIL